MSTYSYCETMAAYLWHIRILSDSGPKYGGGADTPTLCGLKPSWDVKCKITDASLASGRFGAGKTCPECAEAYRKDRSQGKEGP